MIYYASKYLNLCWDDLMAKRAALHKRIAEEAPHIVATLVVVFGSRFLAGCATDDAAKRVQSRDEVVERRRRGRADPLLRERDELDRRPGAPRSAQAASPTRPSAPAGLRSTPPGRLPPQIQGLTFIFVGWSLLPIS